MKIIKMFFVGLPLGSIYSLVNWLFILSFLILSLIQSDFNFFILILPFLFMEWLAAVVKTVRLIISREHFYGKR